MTLIVTVANAGSPPEPVQSMRNTVSCVTTTDSLPPSTLLEPTNASPIGFALAVHSSELDTVQLSRAAPPIRTNSSSALNVTVGSAPPPVGASTTTDSLAVFEPPGPEALSQTFREPAEQRFDPSDGLFRSSTGNPFASWDNNLPQRHQYLTFTG